MRVNKEKGLAKDRLDSGEPIVVKCVDNQDNSNACRADSTNEISDGTVSSSVQSGCEGPGVNKASGLSSEFLNCPEGEIDSSDIR